MSEMRPPESGHDSGAPAASETPAETSGTRLQYQSQPGEDATAQSRRKRRWNWSWFGLGFATSTVLGVLGWLALSMGGSGGVADFFSSAAPFLYSGVFIVMLVLVLVGLVRGNDALRSFGVGGLIPYAVVLLGGLLLFGACLVSLGNYGR